jgi:hypothetical protein
VRPPFFGILFLAITMSPAFAFAPDGCQQQRAMYPKKWNDVSKEKPLFLCSSHYGDPIRVTIGQPDEHGRQLMSLVPTEESEDQAKQDAKKNVYRIWLDYEQVERLLQAKYFATIVRQEHSCWIRGSLSDDPLFFMDNTDPPSDEPAESGSFYNKAPRFSVFQSNAYDCGPIK